MAENLNTTVLPPHIPTPHGMDLNATLVQEKRTWPGWATLESEPALFTELLDKIGVKDTQVDEVWSLDELPTGAESSNRIRGLIFLFRWKVERDAEDAELSCPEGVWFANQVTENMCATLALFNIVLNCEDVEIGDELRNFKDFSKDIAPPHRGLALSNFPFVRECHNSFASKSEMMGVDINLYDAAKRSGDSGEMYEEEEAFHYVAYVHIRDALWELDGLKRQPVKLATCTKAEWLGLATPVIKRRMAQYDEDVRFTLMAVVKKELAVLREKLLPVTRELEALESKLGSLPADGHSDGHDQIDEAEVMKEGSPETETVSEKDKAKEKDKEKESLAAKRSQLMQEQRELEAKIRVEEMCQADQKIYATRRQHTYAPFIRKMIGYLADKGLVQERLDREDSK